MKKDFFKSVATLVVLGLILMSCEKDFLDTEPSEFFTQEQISDAAELDPGVVEATMRGIYSLMIQTETGGTTGDDDFGSPDYVDVDPDDIAAVTAVVTAILIAAGISAKVLTCPPSSSAITYSVVNL